MEMEWLIAEGLAISWLRIAMVKWIERGLTRHLVCAALVEALFKPFEE